MPGKLRRSRILQLILLQLQYKVHHISALKVYHCLTITRHFSLIESFILHSLNDLTTGMDKHKQLVLLNI